MPETTKLGSRPKPRSAREFPWTKEEDALLGQMYDSEVVSRLNRTLAAVRDRRCLLGITALDFAPQELRKEEKPRGYLVRLFNAKGDSEIRRVLGWSLKKIRSYRSQLARGGRRAKEAGAWTVEDDRLLGTMSDEELARKLRRPVRTVRSRRWTKRIRLERFWRPEEDKLLGTRSDSEVARLTGRSVSNISWRRNKLGIPPFAKPRQWLPEEEALLGKEPDIDLARRFDRGLAAVRKRRIDLGRPNAGSKFKTLRPTGSPGARKAAYCTWPPEEDALLGKFTDAEVARKLGYTLLRVRNRRRLLGVANNNPARRRWTLEEITLLGTRPDREVAPLVGRTLTNVRFKRLELGIPYRNERYEAWKPEEVSLLGKIEDEEIARQTGHSMTSIRTAKVRLGIRSLHPVAPDWQPHEEALLGTRPDEEIARQLNRTVKAVAQRRFVKGIPIWRDAPPPDPP